MKRILLVVTATLLLAGCGVKNDLVRPNGQPTARGQIDPSRPPEPVGR